MQSDRHLTYHAAWIMDEVYGKGNKAYDKLDIAIPADRWGQWNLAPDGTAAVFVALHRDESLGTGRGLVAAAGGRVTGEVVGINTAVAATLFIKAESTATLAMRMTRSNHSLSPARRNITRPRRVATPV